MLTISEIRARAQAHIDANPLWHSEYRYVLREPVELPEAWFFWYSYEHVGDLPPDRWEQFLGAAGFLVSKSTGEVEITALVPQGVIPAKQPWLRFWRAG